MLGAFFQPDEAVAKSKKIPSPLGGRARERGKQMSHQHSAFPLSPSPLPQVSADSERERGVNMDAFFNFARGPDNKYAAKPALSG